jgi:prevent-host-death family protein
MVYNSPMIVAAEGTSSSTTTTISVSEARATLPEILSRVEAGEEITLTRHGVPVAVVVHPGTLRHRRAATAFELAKHLGDRLDAERVRPFELSGSVTAEFADDLVRSVRADRDGA